MHDSADLKYKSSILSLIANLFNRSELKDANFQFSNSQFQTALKKANNNSFFLTDYQRFIPPTRSPIEEETYTIVFDFLIQNSRISSNTIHQNSMPFNSNIVYYLEKPKREIYYELKVQHPELRLSLSRFYKLCPKNFKKAKKITDMCDVYEKEKV